MMNNVIANTAFIISDLFLLVNLVLIIKPVNWTTLKSDFSKLFAVSVAHGTYTAVFSSYFATSSILMISILLAVYYLRFLLFPFIFTIDCQVKCNKINEKNFLRTSKGVRKPRRFLGLLLMRSTTFASCSSVIFTNDEPFGKNCLSKPLVFSLCLFAMANKDHRSTLSHARCCRKLFMSCKFFAVIHSKAFLQFIRYNRKSLNSSFIKRIILPIINFERHKESGFTFNMSAETSCFSLSENCITFPMTILETVFSPPMDVHELTQYQVFYLAYHRFCAFCVSI